MTQPHINSSLAKYIKNLNELKTAPKHVLTSFSKIEKQEDKVRFALQLLKNTNGLLSKSEITFGKHEIKAEGTRLAANEFYRKREFYNALQLYNRSLCLSVKGSKTMGLSYANRSAIYFNTGLYTLCLENIELALQSGYPEELKFKLVKRKNDCLYELKQGREKKIRPAFKPELSYPAHPTIPFMVEGIEMKVNQKYGRHLVAKQDFNPGDVLLIEKPTAQSLSVENVYIFCLYCLKSNFMSLLPCEESLSAMFCSEKCYQESMSKFYKYEKQIIDAVYNMQRSKLISFRMAFEIICLVKDFDGLKEFLDSTDSDNSSPFDIDYRTATRKDLLRSFFTLESHEKSRPTQYDLDLNLEAAHMYHLIAECTDVKKLIITKEHENTLMKLLLRISMILSINWLRVEKLAGKEKETGIEKAEGSSLIIHLFNHSCDANVAEDGEYERIVFVTRPIKAGEQLFMNLGELFLETPKQERQKSLKSRYFFDCTCVACEKNYPVIKDLPVKGIDFSHIRKMFHMNKISLTSVGEPAVLKQLLEVCFEFKTKYASCMPCFELFSVYCYRLVASYLLYYEVPLPVILDVQKN